MNTRRTFEEWVALESASPATRQDGIDAANLYLRRRQLLRESEAYARAAAARELAHATGTILGALTMAALTAAVVAWALFNF